MLKGLAKCFDDPDWGTINDLVIIGKPLIGEDNPLIVKAEKVLRVLEKEWSHFHRKKERRRVQKRAGNRKYESVELELDREFVKGNLQIIPPPLSPTRPESKKSESSLSSRSESTT